MNDKCTNCGKEGEMPISINGIKFCSFSCSKQHRYRPNMTDETFEENTTIDEIELDGGKEYLYLKAVDSFYTLYSGYKVIVTTERIFYHKQLCRFKTVKDARSAWDILKKNRNLKSWADQNE